MSKHRVMFAAMIGFLALVLSAPATAVGESKRRVTTTNQVAFVDQSDGFPNVGSTAVVAGVIESSLDGRKVMRGASENHVTITGGDLATGLEFESEERWYYAQGSIRFTNTGTATLEPDSGVTYAGESRFRGGTGVFRGARGKATFSGSSPTPLGVATIESEGVITY